MSRNRLGLHLSVGLGYLKLATLTTYTRIWLCVNVTWFCSRTRNQNCVYCTQMYYVCFGCTCNCLQVRNLCSKIQHMRSFCGVFWCAARILRCASGKKATYASMRLSHNISYDRYLQFWPIDIPLLMLLAALILCFQGREKNALFRLKVKEFGGKTSSCQVEVISNCTRMVVGDTKSERILWFQAGWFSLVGFTAVSSLECFSTVCWVTGRASEQCHIPKVLLCKTLIKKSDGELQANAGSITFVHVSPASQSVYDASLRFSSGRLQQITIYGPDDHRVGS